MGRITEQGLIDVHPAEGSDQASRFRVFSAFDFIYEVELPALVDLAVIAFIWSNIVSVIEIVLAGFVLP